MDQAGMWKLFFATGLPQAYLAARSEAEAAAPPGDRAQPVRDGTAVPGQAAGSDAGLR